MNTKKELFGIELSSYLKADKKEKGIILNNLERQTLMHRDSIIRAFKRLQLTTKNHTKDRPGRSVYYDCSCMEAIRFIWESCDYCCGELLHPQIHERIQFAKEISKWEWDEYITEKVMRISIGTLKRRLPKMRTFPAKRGISTTSPSAIKDRIPLFQGDWKNVGIGNAQIDTVAHCGSTTAGTYVCSLGFIDICTGWTIYRAQ